MLLGIMLRRVTRLSRLRTMLLSVSWVLFYFGIGCELIVGLDKNIVDVKTE